MSDFTEQYLKLAYSPTEAAAIFGQHVIRKAIADKRLTPRKVGVRSLIATDELLAFLRSHPVTPTSRKPRSTS